MAPVPEDNQEKPSKEDSDFDAFSNPAMGPMAIGSDSSDDETYPETTGYTLLSQEPDENISNNEPDNNLDGEDTAQPNHTHTAEGHNSSLSAGRGETTLDPQQLPHEVPSIPSSSKDLLWNKKRGEKSTFSLDSAQENKILNAMSSFALPSGNVPDWARDMSEDEWSKVISEQMTADQNVSDVTQHSHTTVGGEKPQKDWVAEFPDL